MSGEAYGSYHNEEKIDQLYNQLLAEQGKSAKLEAEVRELMELLMDLEWSGIADIHGKPSCCPSCGEKEKYEAHADHCPLGNILKES